MSNYRPIELFAFRSVLQLIVYIGKIDKAYFITIRYKHSLAAQFYSI